MRSKERAPRVEPILSALKELYRDATTALVHENAYELLVATMLSAQANDKLVNTVTPALFARYPSAAALAEAEQSELEGLIGRVNFFRTKAKNLRGMAQVLVAEHGGEVPRTMAALCALPGVARKTANVVLGTAFGIVSGIVVDTHVARLAQLIGLSDEQDAVKIERDLMRQVPKESWIEFSHMLIHHGRAVCVARRPRCDECVLAKMCRSAFTGSQGSKEQARRRAHRP